MKENAVSLLRGSGIFMWVAGCFEALFVGWVELAKPMRPSVMGIASLNAILRKAMLAHAVGADSSAIALSPTLSRKRERGLSGVGG
ncbi:MAG: hypothetical protein E2577_15045 [Starkeya sp.]|nr:hypothetical protein [Starkeya sp.]